MSSSSLDDAGHGSGSCLCSSPAFARLNALVTAKVSRRSFVAGAAAVVGAPFAFPRLALARIPCPPKTPIAFTNARLFDGRSNALRDGLTVTIEGNKIKSVEQGDSAVGENVQVIDGRGRVLMPGLIDNHWHTMMAAVGLSDLLTSDAGYINLVAADQAEQTLLRGFTSVRDMAGPSFGLKRAIDSGLVPGPRIWPSGAMISQTAGHGDYRMPTEVPAPNDARSAVASNSAAASSPTASIRCSSACGSS